MNAMSYRALYRVWRPQSFRDLVGQEHVTTTLANALTSGHISHAYLFSGPRGTGKTSAAKIFAKAVNCIHGPTAEPCNECPACTMITEGIVLDVVEIDAASNRGVDEIRDLRDKVKYAPTEVRYKVYIIDEVHMLTTEAFNALLKTLEEPPSHVIFVLATTEPHKLPATIVSRCQRFPFRRIPHEKVVERLVKVVEQEGIEYQLSALEQIARFAEGGLRDALSLLDQAISFSKDQLTEDVILGIIGGISTESVLTLLEFMQTGDVSSALKELEKFFTYGIEVNQVVHDLLKITRDLLLAKTVTDGTGDIQAKSEKFTTTQLLNWADQLVLIGQQLKWVTHPELLLELFVIKHCQVYETAVEQPIKQDVSPKVIKKATEKAVSKTDHGEKSTPLVSPKQQESLHKVWPTILQSIKQQRMTLYAWLADGQIVETSNNTVIMTFVGDFHCNTVLKPENKQFIEQEIERELGHALELKAYTRNVWEKRSEGQEDRNVNPADSPKGDTSEDIVNKAITLFGKELVSVEDN